MRSVTPPDLCERPSTACLLCPPPSGTRRWRLADPHHRTCELCLDRLRENLKDIGARYFALTPMSGSCGELGGRGTPGFGSRPPGNLHIMVMRDPRSSADAHVWMGGDGRVHQESDRPPLSVWSVLITEATDIAERRGFDDFDPGLWTVDELVRWLDKQLDWVTRQETVSEFGAAMRTLLGQLKPVTGDALRFIGRCPTEIEEGEHVRICDARLYAPRDGDTVRCGACGRSWGGLSAQARLGELLESGVLLETA